MEVDDVPRQPQEQAQRLKSPLREKDIIMVGLAKAREIDHPAPDSATPYVVTDGDKVGLNTAMGRWERPHEKHLEGCCWWTTCPCDFFASAQVLVVHQRLLIVRKTNIHLS
jgi:hypothetical protein